MQGVSQERKKLCVLHELGDKTQLGVLVGGGEGGGGTGDPRVKWGTTEQSAWNIYNI